MKRKILVLGSNGQVGSELRALAGQLPCALENEYQFSTRLDFDTTRLETVQQFLASSKPDCILNCLAYTAVDLAESQQEDAFRVNRDFVKELALYAGDARCGLVQLSTDFVYNGQKSTPYVESDEVGPLSVYGESKLAGEHEIFKLGVPSTIIRTSWVHSHHGANFVKTILRLASQRKELNVIFDQVGSPTSARDLAQFLLQHAVSLEPDAPSIFHFSNEGTASWFDFAQAIKEIWKLDVVLRPIETHEFQSKARRPHFSVMNKKKVRDATGVSIPHWRDSLESSFSRHT